MRIAAALLLGLSTLSFAAGCSNASYAKVQAEKTNPQFKGERAKKVLLVMFTQDVALREDIETQFAVAAYDRKLDIFEVSHRIIPNIQDVTRERLEDLVRTNSYDRVVVIRLVAGKVTTGQNTRYGDYYTILPTTMYDYWGMTMATTFTPTDPPPTLGRYVTLPAEAVMFDAKDATVLWNSSYSVTTSEYRVDAAKAFVKTVLSQLEKAGLI